MLYSLYLVLGVTAVAFFFMGYFFGTREMKLSAKDLTDMLRKVLDDAIQQAKQRKV